MIPWLVVAAMVVGVESGCRRQVEVFEQQRDEEIQQLPPAVDHPVEKGKAAETQTKKPVKKPVAGKCQIRVLIREKNTLARRDLPSAQVALLGSTMLRAWFREHDVMWRLWPQGVDVSFESSAWQDAEKLPCGDYPWVFISNGGSTTDYSGPLPKDLPAMLELLESFVCAPASGTGEEIEPATDPVPRRGEAPRPPVSEPIEPAEEGEEIEQLFDIPPSFKVQVLESAA